MSKGTDYLQLIPMAGVDSTTPDVGPRDTAGVPYRQLVSSGFNPREAANLTAYVNGIAVGRRPWNLRELNELVFLRYLYGIGRFAQ